jgi:hypothetical protein
MHTFDPHRIALRRPDTAAARNDAGGSKSLDGTPPFGKIMSEIGLILLVALGLPVAVALLARIATLF